MQLKSSKQTTFFLLYVAQSVPMSLISTLLPVLMRQEQFSLTTIGMLQFIKLPWILKVLWAPLVDDHTSDLKSYKQWIWGSEIAYALLLFTVAFLRLEVHFPLILTLVVLAFTASATQDIATDALTSICFRGQVIEANRLQSMGQFAGTILGGGVLMLLYYSLGWTSLYLLLALLVMLLILPLRSYRAEGVRFGDRKKVERQRIGVSALVSFFRQKGAGQRVGLLVLFNMGLVGTMAMMKPYLVDAGYSLSKIGMLFTIYGASMGFVGSMICSRLRKVSAGNSLYTGLRYASALILTASIVIATLASVGLNSLAGILVMLGFLWLAYGFGTVMIYSVAMDHVRPEREGTDFTLQIVLMHLGSVLIAGLSGKLAELMGYTNFFWLEALLALLSSVYVFCWTRSKLRSDKSLSL